MFRSANERARGKVWHRAGLSLRPSNRHSQAIAVEMQQLQDRCLACASAVEANGAITAVKLFTMHGNNLQRVIRVLNSFPLASSPFLPSH